MCEINVGPYHLAWKLCYFNLLKRKKNRKQKTKIKTKKTRKIKKCLKIEYMFFLQLHYLKMLKLSM